MLSPFGGRGRFRDTMVEVEGIVSSINTFQNLSKRILDSLEFKLRLSATLDRL